PEQNRDPAGQDPRGGALPELPHRHPERLHVTTPLGRAPIRGRSLRRHPSAEGTRGTATRPSGAGFIRRAGARGQRQEEAYCLAPPREIACPAWLAWAARNVWL